MESFPLSVTIKKRFLILRRCSIPCFKISMLSLYIFRNCPYGKPLGTCNNILFQSGHEISHAWKNHGSRRTEPIPRDQCPLIRCAVISPCIEEKTVQGSPGRNGPKDFFTPRRYQPIAQGRWGKEKE